MPQTRVRALLALGLLLGFALAPALSDPVMGANRPRNDKFDRAKKITSLPYTKSQNTANARKDASDPQPTCNSPTFGIGHTVWYKLKLDSTTAVEVNTFGSLYDTVLAVYTVAGKGEDRVFTEIACNDDSVNDPVDPFQDSQVFFTADANTAYYILVGDFGNFGGGQLELSVTED